MLNPGPADEETVAVTVVRATCATCGDIEMTPQDVCVRVCVDVPMHSYTFSCPVCGLPTGRPIDGQLAELLVTSGSPATLWHLPAEMHEPRGGTPLTYDDLLDFHEVLEGSDWLDQIAAWH